MLVGLQNGVMPGGRVQLPPSKSEAIRAALLLGLSGGEPALAAGGRTGLCRDICSAVDAAARLDNCPDAGESAALLRMLICIQASLFGRVCVKAVPRLFERGLWEAEECFGGVLAYSEGIVSGRFDTAGKTEFEIDCSRTSQFLSGLLIALPLTPRECAVKVKNGCVSRRYADMTLEFVRLFGGSIDETETGFLTHPSHYTPREAVPVTGDMSYAAVFEAMNLLGGEVEMDGADENTLQPDKDFTLLAQKRDCDISDCPDIAPLLAVVACAREGRTVIRGTGRLKTKESDRENGVIRLINDLGGSAEAGEDCVIVNGTGRLRGGICDPQNDHRLCFAAAAAALICEQPVTVPGAECVDKSAPQFWNDMKMLLKGGIQWIL